MGATDPVAERAEPVVPFRQGRKVGRTLYLQYGSEPSDTDLLVGLMDTREIAGRVVANDAEVRTLRAENGRWRNKAEQAVAVLQQRTTDYANWREQAKSAVAAEREKVAAWRTEVEACHGVLARIISMCAKQERHDDTGVLSAIQVLAMDRLGSGELEAALSALKTTNEGAETDARD